MSGVRVRFHCGDCGFGSERGGKRSAEDASQLRTGHRCVCGEARVARERHAAARPRAGRTCLCLHARDSQAWGVMSFLRRRSRRMTATACRGLAAVDWISGRTARDATTSDKETITYEVRALMRRQRRRRSGRGEPEVVRPARHVPQRLETSTCRDGRATLCNSALSLTWWDERPGIPSCRRRPSGNGVTSVASALLSSKRAARRMTRA
jgi:hypothetical protein